MVPGLAERERLIADTLRTAWLASATLDHSHTESRLQPFRSITAMQLAIVRLLRSEQSGMNPLRQVMPGRRRKAALGAIGATNA